MQTPERLGLTKGGEQGRGCRLAFLLVLGAAALATTVQASRLGEFEGVFRRGAIDYVRVEDDAVTLFLVRPSRGLLMLGAMTRVEACRIERFERFRLVADANGLQTSWSPTGSDGPDWLAGNDCAILFSEDMYEVHPFNAAVSKQFHLVGVACEENSDLRKMINRSESLQVEFDIRCTEDGTRAVEWALSDRALAQLQGRGSREPYDPGLDKELADAVFGVGRPEALEVRRLPDPRRQGESRSVSTSPKPSSERPPDIVAAESLDGETKPEDAVAKWTHELNALDRQVREGDVARALGQLNVLLDEMLDRLVQGKGAVQLLAAASFVKAVASHGVGDHRAASWYFSVARSLGKLSGQDVVAWLEDHPSAADFFKAATGGDTEAREGSTVREIIPPEALKRLEPDYPEGLRKARVQARVETRAVVGLDGRLEDPELLDEKNVVLAFACLEAAQDWQFKPAQHDGEPIRVYFTLTCNYKLK